MSDISAVAVVHLGEEGAVDGWDDSAEDLFGWTASEVRGRPLAQVLSCPPGFIAHLSARAARHAASTTTWAATRSGAPIPVVLTFVVESEHSGAARVLISRDRNRDDLDSRRLAAIVESSDDAIVSKDLDGTIQSWNPAAERIFGYRADEVIGHSIRVIIPEGRQHEEDDTLAVLRSGKHVEPFQTVRRRKDGSLIDVSVSISPILSPQGAVIGASKVARDITSHKALDAERIRLLEETAAMMGTLNRVGAAVASDLDRTSMMQAVTDAATELTTARCGVFLERDSGSRVDAEVRDYAREAFERCQIPATPSLLEATFRGAVVRIADLNEDPRNWSGDGVSPSLGASSLRSYLAVPVKGRSGEVVGGLFFGHPRVGRFSDHHERLAIGIASWASVALENARLYKAAQEASRLKDDFLASLSHELRTPLNAILGYTRIVRSGLLPPERHERALETIERNTQSLAQIVEDVLDVSRIISGKLRLDLQPLELTGVVLAAIDVVAPTAEAKGVEIEVDIDTGLLQVSGDADRLQQVLWNCLSNAVKFTPRQGRIFVRVTHDEGHAEIAIRDTGIGITPEFLPHLFERFRQMETGTTRERGGLGLGLAIARQLVEGHGGTIEVESPGVGQGSTFRVRIPKLGVMPAAEPDRNVAWRVRPGETLPQVLAGLHVLAVEDEPDALSLVTEVLQAAGAQVTAASSAKAALAALEHAVPDVVVADIGMPSMDGFQLMASIRTHEDARLRDVPAAALTAYARSDDRVKALQAGFQMHLAKPIEPAVLVAAVANLSGRVSAA